MRPQTPATRAGAPNGFAAVREAPVVQQYGIMTPVGFALVTAFVFLLFSRVCDFFAPTLHLPFVISAASLVALVFSGNLFVAISSKIGRYLLLFTGWLVVTIPFSQWRGGSYDMVILFWLKSVALFLVISGLVITVKQSMTLMRTIAYAMLVTGIIALAYGARLAGRMTESVGMFSGPNELALAMLLGCIYSWFIFSNAAHGLFARLVGLLALVPMLYVMAQTGSRAGMVSLGVMVVGLFAYYSMGQRIVLFLFLTIGLASAVMLVRSDVRHRYLTMFSVNIARATTEEDFQQQLMTAASANERWYLLKASLVLTLKHPLFGVGPGQFQVAESSYALLAGRRKGAWLGTHNTYTEFSSEAGIPALILFVLCMLACRKELAQVRKLCKSFEPTLKTQEIEVAAFTLKLVLLCLAVFYLFEHDGYTAVFPSLAGLILAFSRAARSELAMLQPVLAPAGAVPTLAAAPAGR